ncbi:hypothetical protein XENTR_v10006523 [Xenopus tropicalis]|nr:hypothetical protein XENTR_v10006523 [Xenopus tropicalis]
MHLYITFKPLTILYVYWKWFKITFTFIYWVTSTLLLKRPNYCILHCLSTSRAELNNWFILSASFLSVTIGLCLT